MEKLQPIKIQSVDRAALTEGIRSELKATLKEVKKTLEDQIKTEVEMDERVIVYKEKYAQLEKLNEERDELTSQLTNMNNEFGIECYWSNKPEAFVNRIVDKKVEDTLESDYPMTHMTKSIIRAKLELMTDEELQEYTLEDLIEDLFFVEEQ
jgi:hypothetical protein